MPTILPLDPEVIKQSQKHGLGKKLAKSIVFLASNPSHPSLHTELIEPKHFGVYSFRLDRKYRGLFLFRNDRKAIEVVGITVHYH